MSRSCSLMLASPEILTAPCTTTFTENTDRYLNQRSFHHPSIKSSVNRTLVQRAYNLWDPDSLPKELRHIKTTLQCNGYKPSKINTSKPVPNPSWPQGILYTKSNPSTCLPYLGSTSHKLQRILQQARIKFYHSAPNKLQGLLHTHKPDPSNRAEYTGSLVSVAKSTSGKHDVVSQRDWKNTEHTAAEDIAAEEKSAIVKHSDIRTTGRQLNTWHPIRIREASSWFLIK